MTYEQWCKRSKFLIARADMYNDWRDRARMRLLTDIAPRIGKLSTQFYTGCGFHYGMEQQLGKLLTELALPVQFSANHCDKIESKLSLMPVMEVLMESLVANVVKAEKSVEEKQ